MMTHGARDAIARQCPILLLRIVRRPRPLVDDVAREGFAKGHVRWGLNSEGGLTVLSILSWSIDRQLALDHHSMTMQACVLHASRFFREEIGLTLQLGEEDRITTGQAHR